MLFDESYRNVGGIMRRNKDLTVHFFRGFVEEALRNYFHFTYDMTPKHAEIMAKRYFEACLENPQK